MAFHFVCFPIVIQNFRLKIQIFEKKFKFGLIYPESRAVIARHIYSLFVYKVISVIFPRKGKYLETTK